jgi:hypothetical protein
MLFLGDGKGGFDYVPQFQSGYNIKGNVRSIIEVNGELLFGINNEKIVGYRLR